VHDSIVVPEPAMLDEDSVQLNPVVGETAVARLTTPLNPLTGVSVTVEFPIWPTSVGRPVGLVARVKSWTT
jgi:hypothetical protein